MYRMVKFLLDYPTDCYLIQREFGRINKKSDQLFLIAFLSF